MQKRFHRKSKKLNPLHLVSDMYFAYEDQQKFLEFNSLLCNNLHGLSLGITVSILDFASAASKDERQDTSKESAAIVVELEPKQIELKSLEYNPTDLSTKLGAGGFSTVRSGKFNGQAVAIKHVQQLESFSPKDLKMINKEAMVMQFADHPHIVRLKGVSLQRGLIIMELAVCSLADILHPADGAAVSPRAQPINRAMGTDAATKLAWKLQVIRDIADAVAYLHDHNILHRDIKSPNVMLFLDAASGRTIAKIGDFGLALAVELVSRTAGLTGACGASPQQQQRAVGTYSYMAPELFDRQPGESVAYSEASDMYSLGILINEIMTERVPWGATARELDVLMWVLHQQLRPDQWGRNLTSSHTGGDSLYDIVGDSERPHCCLHQLPAQRPSAQEVLQVAAGCIGSGVTLPVPPQQPTRSAPSTTTLVTKRVTFTDGSVYDGQWKDDKMEGQGVYTYASGNVYYGQWEDGKKEGLGVMKFADGSVYDGQWKNSKPEGHGVMKCVDGTVYDGQWKDGNMEGSGVMKFDNADVYDGQWKDGKMEGHGVYKWVNGNVYDGQWKDGNKEGHGVYKWADGNVYDGQWKDDKKEGHGVYKCADGDVYDGEWKDDKKEGHGVYKHADGTVEDGQWKDDKFLGQLKSEMKNRGWKLW